MELRNGHTVYQGYTPNQPHSDALDARTRPHWGAGLDALAEDDDNGDRYNYRPLMACLQAAGLNQWLVEDGDYLRLNTYDQGNTNSCHGNARAMQLALEHAVQIVLAGASADFKAMPAPEVLASFAQEIDGTIGSDYGASCSGEVEGSEKYGVGFALPVGNWDLSQDNAAGGEIAAWAERLRLFVRKGVPIDVSLVAKQHTSIAHTRIETCDQAWAATGHGFAILAGSNVSYDASRNEEGVIRRTGRAWAHAMTISSRRTSPKYGRLFLIHNSWFPRWTDGPYWLDQPVGSFWATWDDVATMLTCKWGRSIVRDSWVSTGNVGFVRRARLLPDWSRLLSGYFDLAGFAAAV